MDLLTILSLAGNIIQFVDFGTRILCTTRELYKSTRGTLAAHEEIALVTTDLSRLVEKLKHCSISSDDDSAGFSKICDEAASLATEIITKLGGLKIDSGKTRALDSIRKAIKDLWSKDELNALVERLGNLRKALDTRVLVGLL